MRALLLSLFAPAALLLASTCGWAFKLQPVGGEENPGAISDRQAAGFLRLFTSDVHERITRRAYEQAQVTLPADVMAGVRWNDNPPAVRLAPLFGGCQASDMRRGEQMDCWFSMLRVDRLALETVMRREKSIAPLRSHFGDMQFLHAMAPRAEEPATRTLEKILRWCEFTYAVARGDIGPRVNVHGLRDSPLSLEPQTAAWVASLFGAPEKQLWRVGDIFLARPGDLRLVAFGTLLHLVEDSYSASHVRRETLRAQANACPSYQAADAVVEFHTYAEQDTEKHALCDDPPDWLEVPREGSPVDVIAALVRAYHDGAGWPVVKRILEEDVFRLAERTHGARAGRCFERRAEIPDTEVVRAPPIMLDASCRNEISP